ncbi:MAG: hypothetical protein ACK4Y5_20700 [Acetobacteraceae bacterium]|jgi:hypothetical protein
MEKTKYRDDLPAEHFFGQLADELISLIRFSFRENGRDEDVDPLHRRKVAERCKDWYDSFDDAERTIRYREGFDDGWRAAIQTLREGASAPESP